MKKYIFLCMNFHGISGGPSYINNKSKWLESNGWKVYGFSGYVYGTGPVVYDGLIKLNKSLISELTFHSGWFGQKNKGKVIGLIKRAIDFHLEDEVIVESNSLILSEWGELISAALKAKHLIYLIAENLRIREKKTFDYLDFKYKRDELFTISSSAFENLFADYLKVKDAEKHFWDAMSSNCAEPVATNVFNHLPAHDWMITHFGRYKDYFPHVLKSIETFALQNKSKKILFTIVGNNFDQKALVALFKKVDNVELAFFEPMVPIPQKLFDISDVVISTAGCACISFKAGAKTISMDVERNEPLGVLGYTTKEHTFRNGESCSNQTIEQLLTEIIIEGRFTSEPPLSLSLESREFGYDYHLSFVKNNDKTYYEGDYSADAEGKQQKIDKLLVKDLKLKRVAVLIHIINHLRKK